EAWVGKGKGWTARRIAESEARRRAWLDPTRGTAAAAAAAAAGEAEEATSNHSNSHHPYRERTVQAYRQALESFRERLWKLMHMTDRKSAFLWADDVVISGRAAGDDDARNNPEDDDARDNTATDESTPATPSRAPWTDERLWTSDKARRIMQ
ncbi:zinc knuckle, partial [Colletotrichum chrysophilum]